MDKTQEQIRQLLTQAAREIESALNDLPSNPSDFCVRMDHIGANITRAHKLYAHAALSDSLHGRK